jgi:thiamine pyrophosphate-dependent acetolactate synthase large subunit-like protein
MKLDEALAALEAARPAGTLAVSANGYISRALFTRDRPENFYMLGSMGLASAIALGLAASRPERPVVVYDGDGNLLMNLSTLAVAAALAPKKYRHVVLDNGAYASTGGQPTHARTVDLGRLAEAAGYRKVLRVAEDDPPARLEATARALFAAPGPAFLHVRLTPGGAAEGPPGKRVTLTPEELRERFAAAARA